MASIGDFQWEQDIDPTTQTGRTVFNGMKWLDTSEDPPVPKWREGSAWTVMTTVAGDPGSDGEQGPPGDPGPPGEDGAITTIDNTASITLSIVDSELTASIVDLYITDLLNGVFEPADADIQSHLGNTSNPHAVTKSQVGLANTDNTSDAAKPVSTTTQTALNLKADDADLDTHTANTSNPHSVTKSQVGLGNVDNTTDVGKPISTLTQAALDLKQPLDSDLTTIAGLTATTDNFMVAAASAWASRTPAQAKTSLALAKADVGLGNVDNTSDAAKPISTLTQSALDLKAPLASPTFTGTVTLPVGLTGVVRADSGVVSVDADVTDVVAAASDTAAGKVELATTAETTTGTDAARAVTPDGLHDMTSLAGAAWFLDEDAMGTNSDTKVPSQQSVKAYADTKQTSNANLTTIAGLTPTSDNFMVAAASAWASRTPAQAKTSLALVKADVGLANVDNTTDAAKPISTLTQTALDLKATAGAALTEAVEASSTPVAGATSTALGSGIRVFAFFTLPTTEKWYVITGIEWLNKATINGNVWCGVERVDANPPVIPGTVNVATGARIAHAGSNAAQRNSQIASQPIRGGTILGVWFTSDSASATFGNTAVSNNNNRKTLAAGTPALADVTAWTASTAGYYVKAYYQGIK